MEFLDDEYLLETEAAKRLYGEIRDLPVLDPHSHVDADALLADESYTDVWQVVGANNHRVRMLMRTRGVPEEKITGDLDNWEKWKALASVFPSFAGNPTYEHVHLVLKRRFGVDVPISPETTDEIWEETRRQLHRPGLGRQSALEASRVEVVATTDDPLSDPDRYDRLADELDGVTVLPVWRPDAVMQVDRIGWDQVVDALGRTTDTDVSDLDGFRAALEASHDAFDDHGCVASSHAIRDPLSKPVSDERAREVYERAYAGATLSEAEVREFRAYLLELFGTLDREADWAMRIRLGTVEDYRDSLYEGLGADLSADVAAHHVELSTALQHFLNEFDGGPEVVLSTGNPAHYPSLASLSRVFPTVSVGAPWWLGDSAGAIRDQLESVGTVDLLSNYGGMASHSRDLFSIESRFETFRRSLADTVGRFVDRGQVPESAGSDLVRRVAYDRPRDLWNLEPAR
jgi:glucuronate isomerase